MLLSELLHTEVSTHSGRSLGRVRDVRFVQDGPLDGYSQRFRVDALVVARSSRGLRLGYHHGGLRSPWLIRVAIQLLNRHAYTIDWSDVVDHDLDARRITLDAKAVVTPAPSRGRV